MKLFFGASIMTQDDVEIGVLKEIVIHPAAKRVTHLVVQQGLLFPADTLIPIEAVHGASETVIALRLSKAAVEKIGAEYDPGQFVEVDAEEWAEAAAPDEELPTRAWTHPPEAEPLPRIPASLIPPGIGRLEMSDPATVDLDEALMDPGTPVVDSDGKKVGKMREVVTDEKKSGITHLLVALAKAGDENKLIPIDWVAGMEDNRILLAVGKKQVEALPDVE